MLIWKGTESRFCPLNFLSEPGLHFLKSELRQENKTLIHEENVKILSVTSVKIFLASAPSVLKMPSKQFNSVYLLT